MSQESDFINWFPSETQENIKKIWSALPENEQNSLVSLIDKIPSKTNLWRLLVKLAGDQAKVTLGRKHRVAIVGPANVGKSTLYNQFIQEKENHAEVSPIPGTTRENQEAGVGVFSVIDTPGADAVGSLGEEERKKALLAAAEADFLIIIFDAIQGIKKTEQELFETLKSLEKPYVVVLNKIDLVKPDLNRIIQITAENLELKPEQIIAVSAKDAKNLSRILTAIAIAEPGIMAALGQAMPNYRWQLAWRVIVSSASLSGVIALTPLPIIDFVPLLANQTSMVLSVARIYNYKIDLKRARELVVTFGLGYLGRTLFYSLSKLGGIPGWILSAAIAASTTVAMGYAAVLWFDKGERLSNEKLKSITGQVTKTLIASIKDIRDRKNKRKLQEEIELTLKENPLDFGQPANNTEPIEPMSGEE